MSGKAARGQGKENLQQSLINFHLYMYFAQMKGKMTFQISKLRPSSPIWVSQVSHTRTHEWQSSERPRKGELATISHKFSFVHVLCPDEGKNDIPDIKVEA